MTQSTIGSDSESDRGSYFAQVVDQDNDHGSHNNSSIIQLGADQTLALIVGKEMANEKKVEVGVWFDEENGGQPRLVSSFTPR